MAHDQPGKPNTKALLNGRFMFPYNLGKYNFEINYIWIGLLDAAKFDSICNNCIYHVFLIKPLKCYENNLKDKLNFEAQ